MIKRKYPENKQQKIVKTIMEGKTFYKQFISEDGVYWRWSIAGDTLENETLQRHIKARESEGYKLISVEG